MIFILYEHLGGSPALVGRRAGRPPRQNGLFFGAVSSPDYLFLLVNKKNKPLFFSRGSGNERDSSLGTDIKS